mgnify:CR=1 FL=1|tara:strand:+ start:628 stop:813 length:186 start_codon:yes stop_codon:yes gene_type:complete
MTTAKEYGMDKEPPVWTFSAEIESKVPDLIPTYILPGLWRKPSEWIWFEMEIDRDMHCNMY